MAEALSLQAQALLTANALRNLTQDTAAQTWFASTNILDILATHADDLMRSASLDLPAAVARQQPCDPELEFVHVLRDLKAWMTYRLQYGPIKHQRPDDDRYPHNQHPNGYAGVIIPDWEMRQKLGTVMESLEQGERLRPAAGKDESNSI